MTQVEPYSRRPRRPDADPRHGEQRPDDDRFSSGAPESRYDDRGGRYDGRPDQGDYPRADRDVYATGHRDDYARAERGATGYDPAGRDGGFEPRPGGREPGYDPRPGGREGGRPQGRAESRAGGRPPAAPPSRRPAQPEDLLDESERRGSHATTYGQGFSWVVLWTIVGALIPGLGLIAAGWRRVGAAILGALALGIALIAVWALRGNLLKRGLSFAVDPQKLLMLAVVSAAIGVLWVLVILLTNSQLRRYATLDTSQTIFSWVIVAALLVGVGVPTYAIGNNALVQRDLVQSLFTGDDDVDADDAKPDAEAADPWAGTERVNILLIGSDAGATREGIRPDTMIVASVQPSSGNTVLFSLPRNLQQVPFKEGSPGAEAWPNGYYCPDAAPGMECMLNAIWRWAEGDGKQYYSKFKNPGLRATEDAISGATGLDIDTYAMLNLEGFADFIDNIGGVKLNVYERLPIGGNSSHPVAKGWIEKGKNQQMDGYTALWFARSRWSTDDYDRMRRQRCVIGAVAAQASPANVAKNWTKIAKSLKNNMATGIPQSDIQAWVELATRVQGAQVTSLPFTSAVVGGTTVDPDFDLIHEKVQKAIKKSEAAAKKKAETAATPGASASPSAGATTPVKKKKKAASTDPTDAEDVSQVC